MKLFLFSKEKLARACDNFQIFKGLNDAVELSEKCSIDKPHVSSRKTVKNTL